VLTARTRHALLTLGATTGPEGEPLIDGRPWDDPVSHQEIRAAAGPDARPVRYLGTERFDVLPLLVATDGAIAAFGHGGRRLRPNLVIGGVDGLTERSWAGRALRVGEVTIGVRSPRARCVVTTIDPDTGVLDPAVLRRINREFGGRLALDCWVVTPGRIEVGDPVELIDLDVPVPEPGGWITGAAYQVV
jgi:uncharacterized protein